MKMNYEELALELKGMSQILSAIAASPFENPEALDFLSTHLEALAKLVEDDQKQCSCHEHEPKPEHEYEYEYE